MALDARGRRIAGADGADIYLWEGGTERKLATMPRSCSPLTNLTFDPTGDHVFAASATAICRVDVDAGTSVQTATVRTKTPERASLKLEFSTDGAWVVAWNKHIDPQLFRSDDLAAGPVLASNVATAAVSLGLGVVVVADADGIVRTLDYLGEELSRIDSGQRTIARAWLTSDAMRVVTATKDGTLDSWEGSRRLLGPLGPAGGDVEYLDNERVLESSWVDQSAQIWGAHGLEARLPNLGDFFARPAANRHDIVIATKGRLLRWDPAALRATEVFAPKERVSAYVSGSGRRWIVRFESRPWQVVDDEGRLLSTLVQTPVHAVYGEISQDDRRYAAHDGRFVRVWDTQTGALVFQREELGDVALAVSDDGRLVAWTAGRQWRVADIETNTEIGRFPRTLFAGFYPDGKRFLTVEPSRADAWTIRGEKICEYAIPGATFIVVSFSPDGSRVAIGDKQGGVHIWEGDTLVDETRLAGWIRYVNFSPDGEEIAATSDAVGWRWSLAPDRRPASAIHDFLHARIPLELVEGHLVSRSAQAPIEPGVATNALAFGPPALLLCPPGTAPFGAPFPSGRAQWCVDLDGEISDLTFWDRDGSVKTDSKRDSRRAMLLDGARRAARHEEWREVLRYTGEGLHSWPDDEDILAVAGMARCHLGEVEDAVEIAAKLKGARRSMHLKVCAANGIELPRTEP